MKEYLNACTELDPKVDLKTVLCTFMDRIATYVEETGKSAIPKTAAEIVNEYVAKVIATTMDKQIFFAYKSRASISRQQVLPREPQIHRPHPIFAWRARQDRYWEARATKLTRWVCKVCRTASQPAVADPRQWPQELVALDSYLADEFPRGNRAGCGG